ncbi:MAG: hypothetical protein EP330_04200 [Deltaproteobacteria bacterium]|nr:MAG: hypothetical protein EP330_04200 [Deltaproteobacteria bacterium]
MFQAIGHSRDAGRHRRALASTYLLFAVVHLVAGAWAAWWLVTRLLALLLLAFRWLFAPPEMFLLEVPMLEAPAIEELSVVEVEIGDLDEGSLASWGETVDLEPPRDPAVVARERRAIESTLIRESGLLVALLGTTSDSSVSDLWASEDLLVGGSLDSAFGGISGLSVAGVDSGGTVGFGSVGRGGGGTAEGLGGLGMRGSGQGYGGGGSGRVGTIGGVRRVVERQSLRVDASLLEVHGEATCLVRVTVGSDGVPTKVSVRSCPQAYIPAAEKAARAHRWSSASSASDETLRLPVRSR